MIKIFFDPVSKGFYQTDINKNIPPSSIEVSIKYHQDLLKGQSEGKQIVVVDDNVTLAERQVDEEGIAFLERIWRGSELLRSDIELYKVQDSDPKSKGSVSDWRSYRKDLRSWPENQNFPNKEFRPKAPDA